MAGKSALKNCLIALSLFLFSCDGEGDIKVFSVEQHNEENKPGLVRRSNGGKLIERITFEDAHHEYGCVSWDDWNEIIDSSLNFLEEMRGVQKSSIWYPVP